MSGGRVVVLNGTASAGKTTLARAIREAADDPWVLFSQDDFAQALVPHWVRIDAVTDGFQFVREGGGSLHVEAGPIGRRVLSGYRAAAAACARAGNDVLIDECAFDDGAFGETNGDVATAAATVLAALTPRA